MNKICTSIKQLTKFFSNQDKKPVLDNLTFDVYQGEILGIIGSSGAGKTTLLRCLVGLENPSSGTILFKKEGKSIPHSSYKTSMGMIFQHFQLFTSKTVRENIAFPLEIQGISKDKIEKRVEELIDLVDLKGRENHYPLQLSGGQKQRVGIARALANYPTIVFCDEPTSALDPKTTQSVLELLQKLNRELNLTIVMVTHQMHVIKKICDRTLVLSHGKIIELDKTTEIFTNPKEVFTKNLIQENQEDLPQSLKQRMVNSNTLFLRLYFLGKDAQEPIISQLIKQLDLQINILAGSIDNIQDRLVGRLLIEVIGNSHQQELALSFLKNKQIKFEVME
ncbi:Methionine import ATP-binding protein MetN [Candidatus Rubidus massiliensis]|nr:Methionine import ATP-binding protein MetN [Candidatus Rubidus massiliensis]